MIQFAKRIFDAAQIVGNGRARVPTRLQFQTTECGVAALAMILAYHGHAVPMEEIRRISGVSRDCMNAADMVRAARHFGLAAKAYSREPEALRAMDFPFVAHLRFIHFVVVEGMTTTHVLVNDPAVGRAEIALEEFDEKFTGIVVSFVPTSEFRRLQPPTGPLRAFCQRTFGTSWTTRALLLLAGLTGLILALPLLAFATAVQQLVDQRYSPEPLAVILLATVAVRAALMGIQRGVFSRLHANLSLGQANAMLRQLLELPYTFFAYRLPSRLHDTVYANDGIGQILCQELLPVIANLPQIALLLSAAWFLEPTIGVVLTGVSVLFAMALAGLFHWRGGAGRILGDEADKDFATIVNGLEDIESVKLSGLSTDYVSAGLGGSARKQSWYQQAGMSRVGVGTATRVVMLALPWLVLALGAGAWQAGRLTLGGWLAVFLLGAALVPELQRWGRMHRKLDNLRLSLLPVEDVFGQRSDTPELPTQTEDVQLPSGSVRMRAVSFGYAEMKPPLVTDLNLSLAPGEQLGITGPSGGGKSTLGGLLSGLHRPLSGTVEVGGAGASGRLASHTVAWVDKSSFFFEGTVRENLCLWQSDISTEALVEGARDACIDEVLALREGGFDSLVEARGRNFSGGQRQRLEIARALMRNPAVLILDEATDALDPALESRIRANIRRRGCTLVLISHRASTLAACDRVIHVEGGTIVSDTPPADSTLSANSATSIQPKRAFSIDDYARQAAESDGEAFDSRPMSGSQERALRAAFKAVAHAVGQTLPHPPEGSQLGSQRDSPAEAAVATAATLAGWARDHGMAVRRVRLVEGVFWHLDHGPLIAFSREDAAPVALLPQGDAYRMIRHDSDSNALREISAATLYAEAFCLYPRAHLEETCPIQLFRHALRPAQTDLRRAAATSACLWLFAAVAPLAAWLLLAQGSGDARADGLPLWKLIASLLALLVAAGLIEFSRLLSLLRFDSQLESSIIAELYPRLARITPAFVRSLAPEHLARSLAGIPRLLDQLRGEPMRQALDIGVAIIGLSVLSLLDPRLSLLALVLLVPAILLPALIAHRGSPMQLRHLSERVIARRFLFDVLHGIARLRLLKADSAAMSHWLKDYSREKLLEQRIRRFDNLQQVIDDAYPWLACGIWLWLLIDGFQADAGLLVVATLALWPTLIAVLGLGAAWASWVRARGLIAHTQQITNAPLEMPHRGGDLQPSSAPVAIELHAVSYQYPGTHLPVLQNISLRIEPGQLVVIAGPSGGGKSTLLRLLLGFDTPQSGTVRYGDHSLQDIDITRWREQVAAVRQDDRIGTAKTLRGQISGLAPVGLDEVWRAAQQVALAEDIHAMPMGMQTIVEGNKISTGQEQRLLIAAQLIRRPTLLILDEATNAIPEQAQAEVIFNLRALGITCVLVTHRESAIALADRVYVLEAGCLVWSGPPSALAAEQRLLALMRAERHDKEDST